MFLSCTFLWLFRSILSRLLLNPTINTVTVTVRCCQLITTRLLLLNLCDVTLHRILLSDQFVVCFLLFSDSGDVWRKNMI